MLTRNLIYVALFLILAQRVSAQVSLQTGGAEFSIPLFNWTDDKSRLSTVLQLNYESHNGLLVDDVPSNIGQGWNLVAGGVITRVQVGQPDDQVPREGAYNDIKKYPPGYLYNPNTIANGCPIGLANYPIFEDQNVLYKEDNAVDADRELDYFAFEFNGRQGIFVLGKDNGDKGNALGDAKLKIWFDRDEAMPNIRTSITAFHIQDENGIQYTFRDKSINKVTRTHYANIDEFGSPHATGVPQFAGNHLYYQAPFDELGLDEKPFIVGSWYLSEMKDPLTGRMVTFNYNMLSVNTPSGQTMELIQPYNVATTRYITISTRINISQRPALASITYPDGHMATLTYGDMRKDVLGDQVLQRIRIEYQSRLLSQFDMTQSYMLRNAVTMPTTRPDGLLARLCLQSVQQTGVDGKDKEPPYRFDYYLGTNATENCVPALFSPIKDIWGYYNGDANGTPTDGSISGYDQYALLFFHPLPGTLPNNDQSLHCKPKAGYAQNGLLKTVTYPMGGTLTYTYAQNQAPAGADFGTYYGGVHVATTILHDGIDAANDIVSTYNYVLPDETSSSLWGTETPVCRLAPTTYYGPESPFVKVGLPPCDYKYKYGGILSLDEAVKPSELSKFIKVLGPIMDYMLPIEILAVIAGTNPVYLIFDVELGIADCVADKRYLWYHMVDYNYNLLGTNLLPVQYKRVEVSRGAGTGKVVYEFTNPDDFPIVAADISASYSSKQRAAFWAYGLPKLTTIYDASGTKVHQRENHYDFSKAMTVIDPEHSSNYTCYSINRSSRGSDTWTTSAYSNTFTTQSITNYTSDPAVRDQLIVDPYTLFTGRVELQTTYDRFYKDNDHYLEKSMGYQYSPNNYLVQKETTTLSNGDKLLKESYYSGDYTASGILQTMKNNNMLNQPVATYHSVIKANSSSPAVLSAEITDFSTVGTGDIRASRVLVGRTSTPGSTYTFDPANPFNYSGLIQTLGFTYSSAGTLSDNVDEAGRHIGNLYDYNDKYLVASAKNASSGQLAYTSFETTNDNGWIINLRTGVQPVYSTTNVMTGVRSLDLGSVSGITATIGMGKTYTLSFWAESAVTVTGSATLKVSAPQVNGFTYHEYEISAGSAPPGISGGGHIDELRLYPSDTRMSTATYDIVLGKTSACDVDGRITYYEYDPIGRIRLERDENRNIVRMYEYNYKLPQ